MGIFDLFSKRQKRIRREVPDVYTYDKIPQQLRVQVVHIWQDALGSSKEYYNQHIQVFAAYKFIVETLCREYGVFELATRNGRADRNYHSELIDFVLSEQDCEKVLDAVELSFRIINRSTREYAYQYRQDGSRRADEALQELNARFQEHGIGFNFIDGEIIRVDSELIHAEVVKPALVLLHGKEYAGAQSEFLKAHEHYRQSNAKELWLSA